MVNADALVCKFLLLLLIAFLLTSTQAQTLQEYATATRPARRVADSTNKTCPEPFQISAPQPALDWMVRLVGAPTCACRPQSLFNTTWRTALDSTCPFVEAGKAFSSDAWEELKSLLPSSETDVRKAAAYAVNPTPIPWSEYVLSISLTDERRMGLKKWLDSTEAAYPGLFNELCDPGPCQDLVPTKECVEDLIEKDQPVGENIPKEADFSRVLNLLQMFNMCRARLLYMKNSYSTTSPAPSEEEKSPWKSGEAEESSSTASPRPSLAPDVAETDANNTRRSIPAREISETYSLQLSIAAVSLFGIRMVWI